MRSLCEIIIGNECIEFTIVIIYIQYYYSEAFIGFSDHGFIFYQFLFYLTYHFVFIPTRFVAKHV